ncbi:Neuroguidin like [Heracleum sosnowskyi]|uniref:Neuroguidin like n=1 Tax=Heracleum sosnowskyi TaxID=360622 RepID=A0AAD8GTZ8_9APIA|nr:Neuroguidin like [Heracleum sosnowskyi]
MKHLQISTNADPPLESHRLSEDLDSTCSTPYVSAPSSPGRNNPSGYFFSAPASPMHYVLSSSKSFTATSFCENTGLMTEGSFEFEFEISSRFSQADDKASENIGSMTSADELFLNGQIRPMKLSSHLQRPQFLAPLIDLDDGEGDDVSTVEITRGRDLRSRNRSMHRKARSLSPFRAHEYSREVMKNSSEYNINEEIESDEVEAPSVETTPSVSASSSRSSSSGRNSKKWIFLKDLLYRSKSEGRGNGKEKFWSNLSFSQSAREKKLSSPSLTPSSSRDEKDKARGLKEKKLVSPSLTPSSSRDEKEKGKNVKDKKLVSPSLTPSSSRDEKEKGRHTKDKKLVSPSLTPSSSRDEKEKGRNTKGRKQAVGKKSGGKPANGVSKRRVGLSAHEMHYTANRAQAEEMKKKTSLAYRQGLFGCLSFSSKSYGAFSVFTRSLNPVSSRAHGQVQVQNIV